MIRAPLVSRISAAATTYFEVERLLNRERYDAVLLYALPTLGVQTLLLARRYGVPVHFRSIDILNQLVPAPLVSVTKLLEVFELRDGQWLLVEAFEGTDKVKAPPFADIEFALADLWPLPGADDDGETSVELKA